MRFITLYLAICAFFTSCTLTSSSSSDKKDDNSEDKSSTTATNANGVDLDNYFSDHPLPKGSSHGALAGQLMVDASVQLALPAAAVPDRALPAAALPAAALPAAALPAAALPAAMMPDFKYVAEDASTDAKEKPAPGSTVILLDADNNERGRTITDKQGVYAFSEIEPGSYTIKGQAEAKDGTTFAIASDNIQIVAGNVVNLSTLTLAETGAIKGVATLEEEKDHQGIDVYVPGTSFTGKTDSKGRYIIVFVPEGSYDVTFEKRGFANQTKKAVKVASKETTSLPALELITQRGNVAGKILKHRASDHSGIVVELSGLTELDRAFSVSTTTKKDGSFAFEGVKTGVYSLSARFAGFLSQSQDNIIVKTGAKVVVKAITLAPENLLLATLAVQASASIDQTVDVSVTITNVGTEDVQDVIPELLFPEGRKLTIESGPTPDYFPRLKPDESKEFHFVLATSGQEHGKVVLSATAAAKTSSDDTVNANDAPEQTLILQDPGVLEVSALVIPETLILGSRRIPVSLTLKNKGEAAVVLQRLRFVGENGKFTFTNEDGTPFDLPLSGSLKGGESKEIKAFIQAATTAISGDVFARIVAKDGNAATIDRTLPKSAEGSAVVYTTWFDPLQYGDIVAAQNPNQGSSMDIVTVGWADVDADGKLDLLLGGTIPLLLRNNGDGTFDDLITNQPEFTICAGDSDSYYAFSDFDNDGDQDLVLSHCLVEENVSGAYGMFSVPFLLENQGDGTYDEISCDEGSPYYPPFCDYQYTQGHVTVADLDRDNRLDLYYSAGVSSSTYSVSGEVEDVDYSILGQFLLNKGSNGFENGSDPLGVGVDDYDATEHYYNGGFDAPWSDINNDGFPDLFTCEISSGVFSRLFENVSGTAMVDRSTRLSATPDFNCYTAAFGDYDNDGFADLFIGSEKPADDRLYRNKAGEGFEETRSKAGLSREGGSSEGSAYCALWLDFDNDADLDLLAVASTGKAFMHINNGNGTFSSSSDFLGIPELFGGACAAADYDEDGDLDIAIGQTQGLPILLHNKTRDVIGNNYIRVLALTDNNGAANDENEDDDRPAIGARVVVDLDDDGDFTADGKTKDFIFSTIIGMGHAFQNEPIAHIGLGKRLKVDVKIYFPDGSVVEKKDVSANQTLTVRDILAKPTL